MTDVREQGVQVFRELLPGVDRPTAGELLLTIVSLVNAWPVLGHLDAFLVGDGPDRAGRRRAALVASATALAREAEAEAAAASGSTRTGADAASAAS